MSEMRVSMLTHGEVVNGKLPSLITNFEAVVRGARDQGRNFTQMQANAI